MTPAILTLPRPSALNDFMKIFILNSLIALVLFAGSSIGQTPCPADLTKVPGKITVTPPKGSDPVAMRNIRQTIGLLEGLVQGVNGGEIRIYASGFGRADTAAGNHQLYEVAMYFLQYECVAGKVKPEAATDLWFYVSFNRIPFFESNNSVGHSLPNGQSMYYSTYRLIDDFRGFPMLTPLHHPNAKAVWISDRRRLPLRNISRAEMLPAYRAAFIKNRDETIKRLEASLATEQRDLDRIASGTDSPADKDRSRKALLDSNARSRKYLETARMEKAACEENIRAALAEPRAGNPALVEFTNTYCKPQSLFLEASNPRAKAVTVFDDSFFDRTKPAGAAQFIVVYWRAET